MELSPIENAFEKLEEADFFLGLLLATIYTHQPLDKSDLLEVGQKAAKIHIGRFRLEAQVSYLLSAFSNACYSAVESVRRDKSLISLAKNFCSDHPVFYSSGPNGGIRTRNTHFRVVNALVVEGIRRESLNPFDDLPDELFEEIDAKDESVLPRLRKYYISDQSPQDSIDLVCMKHLMDLTKFLNICRTTVMAADA